MKNIESKFGDLIDFDLIDKPKKMNQLADDGDFKALVNAVYHYASLENEEDFELFLKYAAMLIEQGIFETYIDLGDVYRFIDDGMEKAEYYYNEAIKRGIFEAYISIGNLYEYSIDDNDSLKQLEYYEKALDCKADGALTALGEYYCKKQDYDRALTYYNKLLESDKHDMSAESGIEQCLKGIDKKNKLALSVFNNCEKNKNIEEIVLLATCFEEGIGVECDKDEANRLYKLASDNNNAYAMYKVYDKHKYAELSEREKNEMKELLLKSADLGYAESQYRIAMAYFHEEKYELALKYFTLSYNQGHWESSAGLCELYKNGLGVDKDFKKYIEYYSMYLQKSK